MSEQAATTAVADTAPALEEQPPAVEQAQVATPGGGTLALQRAAGNRATRDALEHAKACDCGGSCPRCRAAALQRKAEGGAEGAPPPAAPALATALSTSRGRALDAPLRRFGEDRLGTSLAPVRIHTDPAAAAGAHSVRAHAFTVGSDIYFGRGSYRPSSPEGLALLSHELAHTVQQRGVEASDDRPLSAGAEAAFEREADSVAGALAEGRRTRVRGRLRAGALLRAAWGQCTGTPKKGRPTVFQYGAAELQAVLLYITKNPGDVATNPSGGIESLPETGKNGKVNKAIKAEFAFFGEPSFIKRKEGAGKGDVAGTGSFEEIAKSRASLLGAAIEGVEKYEKRPDILDVERRQVYDVTTKGAARLKAKKIQNIYVRLLNSILREAGLLHTGEFKPGTKMEKPAPLQYQLRPTTDSVCFGPTDFAKAPGVIAYQIVESGKKKDKKKDDKKKDQKKKDPKKKDGSKKPAAKKKPAKPAKPAKGPKGGKPGAKAGGKGAAIYQVAVIATALALGAKPALASAEGATSPEEAILMSLLQSGVPVSEEVEDLIRNDPELVARIQEASLEGKSTEESQKAAQELADLLKEHAHELTPEQLSELLVMTAPAQAADPKLGSTREQIKRALDAVQSGKKLGTGKEGAGGTGEGGKGADAGTGTGTDAGTRGEGGGRAADAGQGRQGLPPEARKQVDQASEPLRELYKAMSAEVGEQAITPEFVREFMEIAAKATPPLTVDDARRLGGNVGSAGDLPSVLASLRAAIDERSKPLPELKDAALRPSSPPRVEAGAEGEEAQESDKDLAIRLLEEVGPDLEYLPEGDWRLLAPALAGDPKPKPGELVAGLFVLQTPGDGLAAAVVGDVKVVAERGPGNWQVEATVQTLYLADGDTWTFKRPFAIKSVTKMDDAQ